MSQIILNNILNRISFSSISVENLSAQDPLHRLKKKAGFYCEVGALDGKELSNTIYLEKELGWSGILCEPNRNYLDLIKKNRPKNILISSPLFSKENVEVNFTEFEGGRSGIDKKSSNKNNYKLKTTTLNKVLEENLKGKEIDKHKKFYLFYLFNYKY